MIGSACKLGMTKAHIFGRQVSTGPFTTSSDSGGSVAASVFLENLAHRQPVEKVSTVCDQLPELQP